MGIPWIRTLINILHIQYIQAGMNILCQSIKLLVAPRYSIMMPQCCNRFSDYFRQKDLQDLWDYNDRKIINKKYRSLVNLWKKPLQKKKLRQARIQQIKNTLPQPQPSVEKFVVHNPALGIKTNDNENMFAVVRVDTRQFKVTKDCMIILDTKPEHSINQTINFSEVLLIGTTTYTSIGRPTIQSAKVEGVIQSMSLSDKIIVFKKKRRKQYKKSFGSRVPLTSVRITNIAHNLTEQTLKRAVPLQ